MNDNILDSIEWHKGQLEKLLDEDDFSKVESELDDVIEKFRLKGSKDKVKRKVRGAVGNLVARVTGRKNIEGVPKESSDKKGTDDDDKKKLDADIKAAQDRRRDKEQSQKDRQRRAQEEHLSERGK